VRYTHAILKCEVALNVHAILQGLADSGAQRAPVMELVSDETRRARMKRGRMPAEEVLKVARQMAEPV